MSTREIAEVITAVAILGGVLAVAVVIVAVFWHEWRAYENDEDWGEYDDEDAEADSPVKPEDARR